MKQLQHNRGVREYRQLNALSRRHGAVLFGSTFASGIHVTELAQDYSMGQPVYNRSVEQLSVFEAGELLSTCVYDLEPDSVFVNLGDADLDFEAHSMEEVLAQYEWILYQIHATLRKCEIYLVSVCAGHPNAAQFNQALRNLARNAGCRYVDITSARTDEHPELRAFGIMKGYLRSRGLCFGDALGVAPEYM